MNKLKSDRTSFFCSRPNCLFLVGQSSRFQCNRYDVAYGLFSGTMTSLCVLTNWTAMETESLVPMRSSPLSRRRWDSTKRRRDIWWKSLTRTKMEVWIRRSLCNSGRQCSDNEDNEHPKHGHC